MNYVDFILIKAIRVRSIGTKGEIHFQLLQFRCRL